MFYSNYLSYISVHFTTSFSLSVGKTENILDVVDSWVSPQRSQALQVRRHWLSHMWILLWSLTLWRLSFAANGVEVTMAFVFQIVTVSSPIPISNATACLNDIQNMDLFRTCISHICNPETSVSWADKHWVYECKSIHNVTSQTEGKKIISEATKMLLLIQSIHTNQPF